MAHLAHETLSFIRRHPRWGLTQVPRVELRAARLERVWRWPVMLVLLATIPAFYAELLQVAPPLIAPAAYLAGALVLAAALAHVASRRSQPVLHLLTNPADLLLVPGLALAAILPSSGSSNLALALRLGVAFLTLVRMVWSMQHLLTRGSIAYLLLVALIVLGFCGLGFWWLEPSVHSLPDGLWLAFTTAATVGFGDVVPTTAASKIFSVFVVLLGYGVLSLVTAAIATSWIETEERRMERDIVRDVHREIASLRRELQQLRAELVAQGPARTGATEAAHTPAPPTDETHQGNH